MTRTTEARHTANLTSAGLANFEAPEGADIVWDVDLAGFGIRTRGKPARESWRWLFKYREANTGKQIKVTLGAFLDLTPEQARKKAYRADVERADKLAKRAEGDAERAARKAEKERPTISRLWEE